MERKEDREKVLVPVRRRETMPKEEYAEGLPEQHEVKVPEVPRRWYVY